MGEVPGQVLSRPGSQYRKALVKLMRDVGLTLAETVGGCGELSVPFRSVDEHALTPQILGRPSIRLDPA